jgi:hypothetical protein
MLNIAKLVYACYNKAASVNDLPEAEIIPCGNSANEKKKLNTYSARYVNIVEHKNIPLPGFTLLKANKRSWAAADASWLVIDPRGIIVRITNKNLEEILHVAGITEGLIQEKCVWSRDNTETKMILVPVSADAYIEATLNTTLLEEKVSIKDVNVGDKVLLQNTLIGIYCGKVSLYGSVNNYSHDGVHTTISYLRRHVIEITDTNFSFPAGTSRFFYHTDPKIIKVIEPAKEVVTPGECVSRINDLINQQLAEFSSSTYFSNFSYSSSCRIYKASVNAVPKVPLSYQEVTKAEATDIVLESIRTLDPMQLIFEDRSGILKVINFPYTPSCRFSPDNFSTLVVERNALQNFESIIVTEKRNYPHISPMYSIDNFVKFYKIIKHIKDDTYVNSKG